MAKIKSFVNMLATLCQKNRYGVAILSLHCSDKKGAACIQQAAPGRLED